MGTLEFARLDFVAEKKKTKRSTKAHTGCVLFVLGYALIESLCTTALGFSLTAIA